MKDRKKKYKHSISKSKSRQDPLLIRMCIYNRTYGAWCSVKAYIIYTHITFLSNRTDVKHLAASLNVRVVTANHLALTREVGLRQIVEVQILRNEKFFLNIHTLLRNKFKNFYFINFFLLKNE